MRRKDDEKEQRIKNAVIEVVLEEGFSDASISKIARRASVSPATVYIYHENKECMLRSIYLECEDELYEYLLSCISREMDGGQIIESLVRGYYDFMTTHQKLFSFIEQFSSCPAMANKCTGTRGIEKLMELLQELEHRHIIRPYNQINVYSLIFNPVKTLAAGTVSCRTEVEELLQELVSMTQKILLF